MNEGAGPRITTVITCFNRRHCVENAIESAFACLPGQKVVVVDDASKDGSADYVRKVFHSAIAKGDLKLIELEENQGVTGAKNRGYEEACGDWVIFLDSDDAYLTESGTEIQSTLACNFESPIVFFRCRDGVGRLVGERHGENIALDLSTYLTFTSFGEALTAVNRRLTGALPPYISSLRGYEGLGCCRLIRDFGPARLTSVVARIYNTNGADRLSGSTGILNRLPLIAQGHWIYLQEFGRLLSLRKRLSLLAKIAAYYSIGWIYRLIQIIKW